MYDKNKPTGQILICSCCCCLFVCFLHKKSLGGTPRNSLYGEVPPKRGTFFRLQVYERVGISQVEVYEMVGESVISVFKKTQKG